MLGDPVPYRIHWPKMADLRVNSMQYRPYGRAATTKLGINARDEPASIGVMCSQVLVYNPPRCPLARALLLVSAVVRQLHCRPHARAVEEACCSCSMKHVLQLPGKRGAVM